MGYHSTKITNGSIYGHSTEHCDESGCTGDEMYLGAADKWDDLEVGGVYGLHDNGTAYAVEP